MDPKIFASNMIKLRTEKIWSQEDLSRVLSVSRQAVSKWETGQSIPDIEVLLHISRVFSLTINDLMEKAFSGGISDIEEILTVDKSLSKDVLNGFDIVDILKAAKGVSPDVQKYMSELYDKQLFLDKVKELGPVRLTEVELLHKVIVEKINSELATR